MRYRKIPVEIEAVQLTWATWGEICDFVPAPWFVRGCYLDKDGKVLPEDEVSETIGLIIRTLESNEFVASQGDYIIKGIAGEYYACKPDIFAKTYEKINRTLPKPINEHGPAIEGHPIAVIREMREEYEHGGEG
jgi:hypothetical protein